MVSDGLTRLAARRPESSGSGAFPLGHLSDDFGRRVRGAGVWRDKSHFRIDRQGVMAACIAAWYRFQSRAAFHKCISRPHIHARKRNRVSPRWSHGVTDVYPTRKHSATVRMRPTADAKALKA